MKSFADIIKSLALGADYVMIGGLINKTIESAGENYLFNKIKVSQATSDKSTSLERLIFFVCQLISLPKNFVLMEKPRSFSKSISSCSSGYRDW